MTLVLLTPVGLDRCCWDGLELPADADVRRHEWPGFGRRARAAAPPSVQELADEVAATYAGPLDVVGVSMGGMVGQHLAARHPERVRSLLVACTGASVSREAMAARAAAAEEGMAGTLDATLERWFSPEARAQRPEHPGVAYARRTLLALEAASFADGWRTIATHDARPLLGAIRAPTTCVAGAADVSAPVARVREISDAVPGARLRVLDGPHMLQLEAPDAFGAALREHLAWAAGAGDAVPALSGRRQA